MASLCFGTTGNRTGGKNGSGGDILIHRKEENTVSLRWCCNSPCAVCIKGTLFSKQQLVSACLSSASTPAELLGARGVHGVGMGEDRKWLTLSSPALFLRTAAPPSDLSVEGVHGSSAFIIPREQIGKNKNKKDCVLLNPSIVIPNLVTKVALFHSHSSD